VFNRKVLIHALILRFLLLSPGQAVLCFVMTLILACRLFHLIELVLNRVFLVVPLQGSDARLLELVTFLALVATFA